MGLLTNEEGAAFDEEYAQIQATRRAQLEAYNAARQAAGETPNPTQSDTDTVQVQDAQTGAQFQIPMSQFGGSDVVDTDTDTTFSGVITAAPDEDGAYIPLLAHANKIIQLNNSTTVPTIKLPNNSTPFPIGTTLLVRPTSGLAAKAIPISSGESAGTSYSLNGSTSTWVYFPPGATGMFLKIATNSWVVNFMPFAGVTRIFGLGLDAKGLTPSGTTFTFDTSLYTRAYMEPTVANSTFAITTPPDDAGDFKLAIYTEGVAGGAAFTPIWPENFQWAAGSAPTFAPAGTYVIEGSTFSKGSSIWYVKVSGPYVA